MIINAAQSNVQVLGDIQEFKTSIDPKNLEFITTLLSSNLYSNPEQSFIREIVSNAWDSHVEAGTTDIPVIIQFKDRAGKDLYDISIRDFGTGLSPERFKTIFCNIGSSTKRESNDFIGCFGIGRYSALACSNTVYITSYYEGTVYYYMMVKSGNCITTNLISQNSTKEKNGVEITIKNISYAQRSNYYKALKYITFFPNIYVEGYSDINNIKIKRFKNFATSSTIVDDKILLGNVLYPLDFNILDQVTKDIYFNIKYTGIVFRFNIGDLEVTPNREAIIYNSSTISKIKRKIYDTKTEITEIIAKNVYKDYDNLYTYWKLLINRQCYDLLNNISQVASYKTLGYKFNIPINSITYKGQTLNSEELSYLTSLFHSNLPNLKALITADRIYQGNYPNSQYNNIKCTALNIIILKGVNKFTLPLRSWLKDSYFNNYAVVKDFEIQDIGVNIIDGISLEQKDKLKHWMFDYLKSKAVIIDVSTSKSFEDFKKKFKGITSKKVTLESFSISKAVNSNYSTRIYYKDINACIEDLKKYKKGIVVASTKDSDVNYYIATTRGCIFIRARKDIIEAFESLKPSFLVDIKSLLTDSIAKTIYTILINFSSTSIPSNNYRTQKMLKSIPEPIKTELLELIKVYYKYNNSVYIKEVMNVCGEVDPYVDMLCKKLIFYNNVYNRYAKQLDLDDCSDLAGLLMNAVILKTKSYRLNKDAYKELKKDDLIKILCKK